MSKIVKLTEKDLSRLVEKVIKEQLANKDKQLKLVEQLLKDVSLK